MKILLVIAARIKILKSQKQIDFLLNYLVKCHFQIVNIYFDCFVKWNDQFAFIKLKTNMYFV